LCVNGRKGIGPATATALFAFAAAREAPAWCGRGRKARVLGLFIQKQREKCFEKKRTRAARGFSHANRREKTTRARERGGTCRGGGGDAQGKASARAVTPTTSAA
jgi:hypothetical protein